jgi:hypothetical protein
MPPATRNRVAGGSVARGVADGIAHPPHRINEFGGKWFVYFGAQMANIDINDIGSPRGIEREVRFRQRRHSSTWTAPAFPLPLVTKRFTNASSFAP